MSAVYHPLVPPKSFGEECLEVAEQSWLAQENGHRIRPPIATLHYSWEPGKIPTDVEWRDKMMKETDKMTITSTDCRALREAMWHKEREFIWGQARRDIDIFQWDPSFSQAANFVRIVEGGSHAR